MNNRLQLYCLFISIVILPIFLSVPAFSQIIESEEPFDVRFGIWVHDIDTKDMTTLISIRVNIHNFPIDAEKVYVKIVGKDYPEITCEKFGTLRYQGESEEISWYIFGYGEMYPHDSYNVTFSLYDVEYIYNGTRYGLDDPKNYNLDPESNGLFFGSKGWLISDHWVSDAGRFIPKIVTHKEMTLVLIREHLVPWFQFIFPLILGEALMLLTLLVSPNYNLISIYLAFIAFSPLNMISIKEFLPHRKTMSLPEYYSLLIIITSIFLSIRTVSFKITKGEITSLKDKMLLLITDEIILLITAFIHNFIGIGIYKHLRRAVVLKSAMSTMNDFNLVFLMISLLRFGIMYTDKEVQTIIKSTINRIIKFLSSLGSKET